MAGRVLTGCIVLRVDAEVHMQEHFVKVKQRTPCIKKYQVFHYFQSAII